ncbi:hypothetical protein [Aquimarina sp. RZ0]|uniref:hypothetical protein n=1 Tax=Aquimarina sp. RZ0 TaxID=2607730 RepID=UPI0011F1B817|nr:hypothetical protein [Aquimarina sp. RZ0]KAA1245745.1 hypothetical protein F0000_10920 [Aquimarina sp. RZ0]
MKKSNLLLGLVLSAFMLFFNSCSTEDESIPVENSDIQTSNIEEETDPFKNTAYNYKGIVYDNIESLEKVADPDNLYISYSEEYGAFAFDTEKEVEAYDLELTTKYESVNKNARYKIIKLRLWKKKHARGSHRTYTLRVDKKSKYRKKSLYLTNLRPFKSYKVIRGGADILAFIAAQRHGFHRIFSGYLNSKHQARNFPFPGNRADKAGITMTGYR